MGKRHTEKTQHSGPHPALKETINAAGDPLSGRHDGTGSGASHIRNGIHDGGDGNAVTARSCDTLASELFARLLLELPGHRREMQSAYRKGDDEQLARATHKLLGGVVYCELADLATALRELKQALSAGDTAQTGAAMSKTLRIIDDLLACSGYAGT